MFDSAEVAKQAMQEFFEPHQVAQVVQALVPALAIEPLPGQAAKPGASRLGGTPDLPTGSAWPVPPAPPDAEAIASRGNASAGAEMRDHLARNLPYAFIGQIDLEEAHAQGAVAQALPPHGRLLFFYDLAVGPWETGERVARVIWDQSPRESLRPAALPPALREAHEAERRERDAILLKYKQPLPQGESGTNYLAPPRAVALHAAVGVPDPAALEMAAIPALDDHYHGRDGVGDAGEAFAEAYEEMREELAQSYPAPGWKRHQLLGSPTPEQDDPRYSAVVVAEYGKEFLDRETWQRERGHIMRAARDWRLLLQLDLADWSGDALGEGTVYFVIRNADLAARRFDRVMAVYQQT